MVEENNKIDFKELDTTILYTSKEIIAYCTYLLEKKSKGKRGKETKEIESILKSYLAREKKELMEESTCLKK